MNVPKQLLWTAGDEPDAHLFNQYVRDTLNFLLDPPEFYLEQTLSHPLTAGTWNVVSFQAIRKDNDSIVNLSGSPPVTNKGTCNTPGWYELEYGGAWGANADAATNRNMVGLSKNGAATVLGRTEVDAIPNINRIIGGVFHPLYLNLGDYVQLKMWHDGTARSTFVSSDVTVRCYIKGKWVSK